jgi:hypothetical protein
MADLWGSLMVDQLAQTLVGMKAFYSVEQMAVWMAVYWVVRLVGLLVVLMAK